LKSTRSRLASLVPFLSAQSRGGEYDDNQSTEAKLQSSRGRQLDEHLSTGHLCRNTHGVGLVPGDQLHQEIRNGSQNRSANATGREPAGTAKHARRSHSGSVEESEEAPPGKRNLCE
jgi:hypothetical protein